MTNKKILACGEKNKEQNRIVLTKKQTNEKNNTEQREEHGKANFQKV